MRAILEPIKTDAPLVVDSNGVPTFSIAFESFQTVARRDCQLFELGDCMELGQFTQSHALNIWWKEAGFALIEQRLGLLAGKGTNH
ncbi:MAG: hypothetical protein WCH40_10815 [Verrucomicrobiales bacterium]